MSNTFNVTSTPSEAGQPPRRFPWGRLMVALLLIGAAVYNTISVAPPFIQASEEAQTEDALLLAGPVLESLEDALAADVPPTPQALNSQLGPLFTSDPRIAAVRLWDQRSDLVLETTRDASAAPRTSPVLPDMGATQAIKSAHARAAGARWLNTAGQLQELAAKQQDIADLLQAAAQARQADMATRMTLTNRQAELEGLADALTLDVQNLAEANTVRDMTAVRDTLAMESDPDAMAKAAAQAAEIADTVSAIYAEERTDMARMGALPEPLAALTPAPTTLWTRIWPQTDGYRLTATLVKPDVSEEAMRDGRMTGVAGYAEVIYATRPAEAIPSILRHDYVGLALVVLALAILAWPRRGQPRKQRRQRREQFPETPEATPPTAVS